MNFVRYCIVFVASTTSLASASPTIPPEQALPMVPESWSAATQIDWAGRDVPSVTFARYEGMPSGTMTVNESVVESNVAHFASGTIDFDMKPLAYSDTGIIFRRQGDDGGEFVYARANPDCPAADDCIQYAPIIHGRMDWNVYADYQGPAPIAPSGWNHFHLMVAGEKMLVYVNHQADPSLVVPRLQGSTTDGGIAFKGPAVFANLIIRSNPAATLPDVRVPAPIPGTITQWLTTTPTALSAGNTVPAAAIPTAGAWRTVRVEASGLVNLGREFDPTQTPEPAIGWLKTELIAGAPLQRKLRIGWVQDVTVFLNGRLLYSGRNSYYPPERRLSPDGRLQRDNATIPLQLQRGTNELVLAVDDEWTTSHGNQTATYYGWAAEAHLDDPSGITLGP